MNKKKHSFPERLKQLRDEQEISQYELADTLKLSRGVLGNYEQGRREPDYDTLIYIANYFGVTTDYMLGISEERELNEKAKSRVEHLMNKAVQLPAPSLLDLEEYIEFLNFRNKK